MNSIGAMVLLEGERKRPSQNATDVERRRWAAAPPFWRSSCLRTGERYEPGRHRKKNCFHWASASPSISICKYNGDCS